MGHHPARFEAPRDEQTTPPPSREAARQAELASQNVDLMSPGTNALSLTPTVYVSTIPTELIQTEGDANLVPIEGTDLMQEQNSDNPLFLNERDQYYYVLLPGRTFSSTPPAPPRASPPYTH